MFKNIKHIHFIGIGGSGMSGIAEVLISLGYSVSGSDLQKSPVVKRLEDLGAKVWQGHQASHIGDADVVVTSTAVSVQNPEVRAAKKAGIPVIPRIEMLAELARLKYTIAVAGTHGKTTTSSLVAQVLKECGLDPTVIVGGRLKAVGTGGVLGKGDYLVAEADESDGSFLKLSPTIAIVTNIDDDHLDYYKTFSNLEKAFADFLDRIPFYGVSLLCGDDPTLRKLMPRLKRRYETYGFGINCDLRASKVVTNAANTQFEVHYKAQKLGTLHLSLAGRHNILNALATVAVGLNLNLTFLQIARAIEQFEGVGRRMELKGNVGGVVILDDYGHHPTEMQATIEAIRERWPKSRLHVVFQPHRFSRTQQLYKQFAKVLRQPDHVFLMPIYPAGEKPIKGISSQLISKSMKKKNWSFWSFKDSEDDLVNGLKTDDVLLTLGAGDVWKAGEDLVLKSHSLAAAIAQALPSIGKRIKTEEPLSRHCTWGIGGPAEVFVEVHNVEELQTVVQLGNEKNIPIFLLGWGSNILLPDEGLRGCVVRLKGEFENIQIKGTTVQVGAGVHLPKLARVCANQNLMGVHPLAGVPGTVGGALMTNAGTKKGSIGDVLEEVTVMDSRGQLKSIPRDQIQLEYRSSSLEGQWVISAKFNLKSVKNGDAWKGIKEELEYRQKTQPLGTKNVGSVFRNPPGDYAARLIESVGLKGKQIGQLRFSPKHANFIENLGRGTAKEAGNLIRMAQRLVKRKFNIDLEPEVKIINSKL
ncbi:hypothetical protein BVX98_00275 [bacterium F11]|nr:hypothetical protein BVX98_00275 [bacterium F11]